MQTESITTSVVSLATQLAALTQEHQDAQIEAGEDCVNIETAERKFRRDEQVQAEQDAKEEAEDAAFWGDVVSVAKCVAAAASVAGSVFTGGSSLVIAAGLIGGGLTIGSEVASKAGADKSLCTGLAIGGAVCSLAAGGGAALTSSADSAAEGGATAASTTVNATTEAGTNASAAANYAGSAATAGEGTATFAQNDAESDEASATADSKEAGSQADVAGQVVEDTITDMQQSTRDAKLYTQTEAALMNSESETNAILVNALRG
jgi:hypothetical protein